MRAHFERLAVLGLGLLGGSVALAARRSGVAECVVGATRRAEVRETALERGVVDAVDTPENAVRGADLVVLATPVYAMSDLVRTIAPTLDAGALVTDVGSVKAVLDETFPGLLPRGVHYVGSHPMAGSHHRGLAHARADLFEGAPCVVMRGRDTEIVERLCTFWRALGARVVLRDPREHDTEVAWMSHVPHVLAFAFAQALDGAPDGAHAVSGPGFRDFTRIAHSEPELWGDILTANRKAIAGPLQAVADALTSLARTIETGDADDVERAIHAARNHLSKAPHESREAPPETRKPIDPQAAPGGNGKRKNDPNT